MAFTIIGVAFAISMTLIKVLPCKLQPICSNTFRGLDTKIDNAVKDAWEEVDMSREDRTQIRAEIRNMEKNEVELKTEVKGIHQEIKEIKESIGSMMGKLDDLNRAILKRNTD
jgi:FtsZ-binding cell division protein ZapB